MPRSPGCRLGQPPLGYRVLLRCLPRNEDRVFNAACVNTENPSSKKNVIKYGISTELVESLERGHSEHGTDYAFRGGARRPHINLWRSAVECGASRATMANVGALLPASPGGAAVGHSTSRLQSHPASGMDDHGLAVISGTGQPIGLLTAHPVRSAQVRR